MCMNQLAIGVLLGLVGTFIAACSDDDGCPQLRRCDIRGLSCQNAVMAAMSCWRGGSSSKLPKVSVLSEDEVGELLRQESGTPDPDTFRFWNRDGGQS